MSRRVVLAGGSGLLGTALAAHLGSSGYEPVILSRTGRPSLPGARQVVWDGEILGDWVHELDGAIAVVNLCGLSIATAWTDENRARLVTSRVLPTRALAEAIAASPHPPQVMVNATGIGVYGDRGDEVLTEASSVGERGDFLVDLCTAWEASAEPARSKCRVAFLRTSPVLSRSGGFLAPIKLLTRLFLGGRWGSGDQFVSWIHESDWVRLVEFCFEHVLQGPVVASSPEPTRNDAFMATVRAVMRRPWAPPTPAFLLRLAEAFGGPPARLALDSLRVMPQSALDAGFEFRFASLNDALMDCLRS